MEIVSLTDPYAIHQDGKDKLTANWNAGAYDIKAGTFSTGSYTFTIDETASLTDYMQDLVDDTTPQLGGDLDGQSLYDLTNMVDGHFIGTLRAGELISADLTLSGDGSIGGDLSVVGTATFGEIGFALIPDITNTYSLGSITKKWGSLYTTSISDPGVASLSVVEAKAAYDHISNDGTDHSLLGATPGTVSASLAVIVDANKDIDFDGGDITTTGNIIVTTAYLASGFSHYGDADTYFTFDDDRFYFTAGGVRFMYLRENFIGAETFYVNDLKVDMDFRISGNNETNLFFTDGSTDRVGIGTATPETELQVVGAATIGDDTNDLVVSSTGVITMTGTAKRALTLRAEMDYAAQIAAAKPTQVAIGIYKGYSFPIWNDGVNADEQMFFRENVPGRWDGASDIIIHLKVALSGAEDVGDKFNLEWAWEHAPEGEPVPASSNSVPVETTVLAGRAAEHDEYLVKFTIDHDIDGEGNEIQIHELLGGRLRRLAASASEIANEIILLDWHTYYGVNKMFKAA